MRFTEGEAKRSVPANRSREQAARSKSTYIRRPQRMLKTGDRMDQLPSASQSLLRITNALTRHADDSASKNMSPVGHLGKQASKHLDLACSFPFGLGTLQPTFFQTTAAPQDLSPRICIYSRFQQQPVCLSLAWAGLTPPLLPGSLS